MTAMKIIVIYTLLFTITSSNCSKNVIDIVDDLIKHHKLIYGDVEETLRWNSSKEKNVKYPRGDKQKLAQMSNAWCAYYVCTAGMMSKVTASKRMPSTILTVYVGATARILCGLCVAPGEISKLVWKYAKSPENMTFDLLIEHEQIVREDKDITIYHVVHAHAGVYGCEMGKSISGLVILHVIDEEEYDVVKPSTSMGPYPTPPLVIKDMTVFTSWSTWSECSSCGKVGRQRRYGICYVKITPEILKQQNSSAHVHTKDNAELNQSTFEDYPEGIPCRSVHLPRRIRELDAVKRRRNEIMIAMCKIPCTDNTNTVTDSVSIPPLPVRKIQFAVNGERIQIRCPGSTLRDMPVSWRVLDQALLPNCLDQRSGRRVHLNARDHLVFTQVHFSDAKLYSCWQGDRLAGTIKLMVWSGHTFWNHHTVLLMMVVAASVLLRYLDRVLCNRQLRLGML